MNTQAWLTAEGADELIQLLPGTHSSGRKFQLFALVCVGAIRDYLRDPRCLRALAFVEAHSEELFNGSPSRNLRRRLRSRELSAAEAHGEAAAAMQVAQLDAQCHPNEWNQVLVRSHAATATHLLVAGPPNSAAIVCASCAEAIVSCAALGFFKPEVLPQDYSVGKALKRQRRLNVAWFRDIFGNPFRPITFDPEWRTDTAVSLAKGIYDSRDFGAMPILADALQDAGCENEDILNHCREANGTHIRGCWVIDLVLGKE